jgi:pyruvate-formate lyase
LKTMGIKMLAMKKMRDSLYSCKYFKFQQGRYVFKEQRRIRLATKYSTHMHILI